ncbi:MAG: TonB family protein [Candidatus Omnitrophica bacterium]|jgi:pilus assembly protein CpaC|nr:TonB family protein [Candidatus Omnitrophota bacterium]
MKKIIIILLLITVSFLGFPLTDYALDEAQEVLRLYLGQVTIIPVSHPSRVAVGNPNIADIAAVTKTEITLAPKAVGSTTLAYWDNFGEQSFKLKVFAENIQDIKLRVDNLLKQLELPEVATKAEEDEAKVLLLGRVKTAQEREKILLALGPLKDKVLDLTKLKEEETIIEIDVQVLELNKDATDTLGLTNPLSTTSGITITEVGSPGISALGSKWSTLFKVQNLLRGTSSTATTPFSWTLYALIQEGKARVLSRPRLACQSGKEAELLVGGEKPVFTTTVAATTGAEGTEVEYKEYGIKLKIKPTVNEDERIKLGLNVEVSEVGTAEFIGSTTDRTAQAYPLSKRTAVTELFLNDGQTMAIGGLMKQKEEEDVVRTPWLSNLPLIGGAFRKKQTKTGGGAGERGDVELFITLTPKIISKDNGTVQAKKDLQPAAVAVTPAANVETPATAETSYARLIQQQVLKNLTYPPQAKESGFEGKTNLSMRLSYLGELMDVAIKSSSGYKILDDNAVAVAREITYYPPFPPTITQKELWIEIPIDYRLN